MAHNDPTTPPDPSGGWSCSIRAFQNAIVVPHQKPGPVLKCGVFTAQGNYVPRAAMWKRDAPITTPPEMIPPVADRRDGTWLWGGVLYGQFGHFITSSCARLWAVPAHRAQLNGVLFVRKYRSDRTALPNFASDFFRHLIGDLPVEFADRTTEFETLLVPGQAFGVGAMSRATPGFRRFVADHFARDVPPVGPENLFITRSQLALNRDGFVGEAIFDDRMERAGYSVFSPEKHDIATQIARYRAARNIVAMDGSALHLVGLVARAHQTIGIILRRQAGRSRSIRLQIESFAGRVPQVIDAIAPSPDRVVGKKALIQGFDMEAVGDELKKAGLISSYSDWGSLTSEEEAFAAASLNRASRSV